MLWPRKRVTMWVCAVVVDVTGADADAGDVDDDDDVLLLVSPMIWV